MNKRLQRTYVFHKMDLELSATALLAYTDDSFWELLVLTIVHPLPYLQWEMS